VSQRTVLVLEDVPEAREWLAAQAKKLAPGARVETFGTLGDALRFVRTLAPSESTVELALVDLGLPDGSGIECVRELAQRQSAALIVVATLFDDDGHLFDALAAGAQGYVLKSEPQPAIARRLMSHFRKPAPAVSAAETVQLSPRETEVLACLGRGMRIRDVAHELDLSDHTVGDYVKSIYRKLEISTRAEAALEAARRGLVPPKG
jgi:DNA-binding NarL/FixJ family response regulator